VVTPRIGLWSQEGASYELTVRPPLETHEELLELRSDTGVDFNHEDTTPDGTLSILSFVGTAEPVHISPGAMVGAYTIVGSVQTSPPPPRFPHTPGDPNEPPPEKPFPWGKVLLGAAACGIVYLAATSDD
jgi:hypothetical protein